MIAGIVRFKVVTMFLLAVLAAMVFWGFLFRAYIVHHSDSPLVQGLVANLGTH